MEFVKTQLGRVIEQIKVALISHTPIVYIPTDQVELLQEILYNPACSNAIVPRLKVNTDSTISVLPDGVFGSDDSDGKFNGIKDNYIEQKTEPKYSGNTATGSPFYHYPILMYSFVDDFKAINNILFSFVCRYQGIKSGLPLAPKILNNVRKSVWIVITPQLCTIPSTIAPYVKTIQIPALNDEEIMGIVYDELDSNGIERSILDEDVQNQIKVTLRGLSKRTIINIMNQLICTQTIDYDMVRKEEVLNVIRSEKRQMLNNSDGLRWETVKATNAAGLEGITNWIEGRLGIFEDPEKAKRNHIDIPNGLLVSGIPGSGKSLMAKTAAYMLGLPLVSLDMGALLGGIVGQSEHNMINALNMAEKMAPCVLWIDEIEKAFSGSSQSSASSDGGVGRRMFGKFLTWMQEKSSACFVFATSNDITCLPPELFRSERFDRKFFTFMPMAEDCAKIFAENIKGQEAVYQTELDAMLKEERVNMPGSLFSETLYKTETWLELLDNCCTKDMQGCTLIKGEDGVHKWANGKRPVNKLFTGADISAIIKEAKFRVSANRNHINKNCVYSCEAMIQEIKKVISEFQPYGETNLRDIVKCFRALYENRFNSAAKQCIVDFFHYDDDKQIYEPSEKELAGFLHIYDKVLFSTIVGAINYYSKEKGGNI